MKTQNGKASLRGGITWRSPDLGVWEVTGKLFHENPVFHGVAG